MMSDEGMERMLERVRATYHVPGATPRDEMWAAIEARVVDDGVIDLAEARARRSSKRTPAFRSSGRTMGWAVAAAAVLVLGIGIGRMSAPGALTDQGSVAASQPFSSSQGSLSLAARDHLGRTESLLTMVRADARDGRVDPETAAWARGLLGETRMLLDAQNGGDPAVDELLLDLELVLIQIAGVAETGSMDEAQARTELELALRTLEEGEVLPRIQAVLPETLSGV